MYSPKHGLREVEIIPKPSYKPAKDYLGPDKNATELLRKFSPVPSGRVAHKFLFFYQPYSINTQVRKFMTFQDDVID